MRIKFAIILYPMKWKKIRKLVNAKKLQERGDSRTLMYRWWDCRSVRADWFNQISHLIKLSICILLTQ